MVITSSPGSTSVAATCNSVSRVRAVTLQCSLFTILFLAFWAWPTAGRAQEKPITGPSDVESKVGQDVLDAIASDGQARVVVALRPPVEMAKPTRGRLPAIRQAVSNRQEEVIGLLEASEHRAGIRYVTLPFFATTLFRAEAVEKLASSPLVLRVDLDGVEEAFLADAVPLIDADSMHSLGHTGDGVVVAILDTGIDTDHPDLADDLIHEACFLDNDGVIDGVGLCPNGSDRQVGPGSAEDDRYHGTHVSGIVTSGGVVSSVGVAPDARIVAIKVLNNEGWGFTTEIIAGLDYIIDNRPDVDIVNMSLGGGLYDGECDAASSLTMAYAVAINTLRAQGVTTFASSGNSGSGTQMGRPACVSGVVSVGAANDFDQMASFTNTNPFTDIIAPGVAIVSSFIGGGVSALSGTSMASPMAAGCAALLLESGLATTPGSIEHFLKSSGVYITDVDNGLSFPRIDCNGPVQTPVATEGLFGSAGPLDGTTCGGVGAYEVNVIDGFITRVGDDGYTHYAVGSSCWRFSSQYTRVYITANDPATFDHWESPSGHIGFINGHNGTTTTTVETSFNTNSTSPTFQAVHSGGPPSPDLLAINTTDGSGSLVGAFSGGSSPAYPALAVHPTTGLMYVGGGGGSAVLYQADPSSGVLTPIGSAGGGIIRYGGMDFRDDGTLFASVTVDGLGSAGANHLATINTSTGAATIIGAFGSCSGACAISGMEGIAFDESGTLYGTVHFRSPSGRPELYTINASTGTATLVAPLAGDVGALSPGLTSLQFVDGSLYGGTALAFSPANDGGRLVEVNKVSGGTSFVGGGSATGGRGLTGLALGAPLDPPPNDDLANAFIIGTFPYQGSSTTAGATSESHEGYAACSSDHGNSIWWSHTATGDYSLLLSTNGSAVNTGLSVWTGGGHPLAEIECDDDGGSGTASQLEIDVEAGETYYIRIIGFAGASDGVNLIAQSVIRPSNDDLENAFVVESSPYSGQIANHGATSEFGELPNSCGYDTGNSIWWTFTAPATGVATVHTDGSDFDTVLGIWTGSSHPLTQFACDDDSGPGLTSLINMWTTAGVTYYFRLFGFGGAEGTAVFNLETNYPEPASDSVAFSVDLSPLADLGLFDPARGDTVEIRADFNGWFCTSGPDCRMTQRLGQGIFETVVEIPGDPGTEVYYKFFFKPKLTSPAAAKTEIVDALPSGWEEPLPTGGANRRHVLTGASGITVLETAMFGGDDAGNVIPAGDPITVTFTVDMTEALSDPGGPFNPAGGDKVHILFEDEMWAFVQGLPSPRQSPHTIDPNIELLHLTGNLYSGSIDVLRPSLSGIQYRYGYGQNPVLRFEDGSGCCNDPGRRRVRYILPFYDGSWPETWDFPVDSFHVAGALPVDSNHVSTHISFDGRFFLEGPYGGGGRMETEAMYATALPLQQPYSNPVFSNTPMAYPHAVSVPSIPVNRVDWVLVELRRGLNRSSAPNGGVRLGLLRDNGRLYGLDGSILQFPGVAPGLYYVVIRHRNHAPVMSAQPVNFMSGTATWTFKPSMSKAYTTGPAPMKALGDGQFALFAADASGDGMITAYDFNQWLIETKSVATGYRQGDFNFDGQVTAADFNIWLVNTKAIAASQVPE